MRTSTRRVVVFAIVLVSGLALVVAVATWPWQRGYFLEWPRELGPTGQSRVVSVRDSAHNAVLLDWRSNSLYVVLAGQGWGITHTGRREAVLSVGLGRSMHFDRLLDDLLIGATDEKIYKFKLPRDAAKDIFLAVWNQHREDVRPLLLEAYQGPDKEELREILERGQPATDTQPASAPSNGP